MGKVTARLEARVQEDIYQVIKFASDMLGKTLTDFIVNAAYSEAVKAISTHQNIQLSMESQIKFVEALSAPHKPNTAMQRAMEKHKAIKEMQNAI